MSLEASNNGKASAAGQAELQPSTLRQYGADDAPPSSRASTRSSRLPARRSEKAFAVAVPSTYDEVSFQEDPTAGRTPQRGPSQNSSAALPGTSELSAMMKRGDTVEKLGNGTGEDKKGKEAKAGAGHTATHSIAFSHTSNTSAERAIDFHTETLTEERQHDRQQQQNSTWNAGKPAAGASRNDTTIDFSVESSGSTPRAAREKAAAVAARPASSQASKHARDGDAAGKETRAAAPAPPSSASAVKKAEASGEHFASSSRPEMLVRSWQADVTPDEHNPPSSMAPSVHGGEGGSRSHRLPQQAREGEVEQRGDKQHHSRSHRRHSSRRHDDGSQAVAPGPSDAPESASQHRRHHHHRSGSGRRHSSSHHGSRRHSRDTAAAAAAVASAAQVEVQHRHEDEDVQEPKYAVSDAHDGVAAPASDAAAAVAEAAKPAAASGRGSAAPSASLRSKTPNGTSPQRDRRSTPTTAFAPFTLSTERRSTVRRTSSPQATAARDPLLAMPKETRERVMALPHHTFNEPGTWRLDMRYEEDRKEYYRQTHLVDPLTRSKPGMRQFYVPEQADLFGMYPHITTTKDEEGNDVVEHHPPVPISGQSFVKPQRVSTQVRPATQSQRRSSETDARRDAASGGAGADDAEEASYSTSTPRAPRAPVVHVDPASLPPAGVPSFPQSSVVKAGRPGRGLSGFVVGFGEESSGRQSGTGGGQPSPRGRVVSDVTAPYRRNPAMSTGQVGSHTNEGSLNLFSGPSPFAAAAAAAERERSASFAEHEPSLADTPSQSPSNAARDVSPASTSFNVQQPHHTAASPSPFPLTTNGDYGRSPPPHVEQAAAAAPTPPPPAAAAAAASTPVAPQPQRELLDSVEEDTMESASSAYQEERGGQPAYEQNDYHDHDDDDHNDNAGSGGGYAPSHASSSSHRPRRPDGSGGHAEQVVLHPSVGGRSTSSQSYHESSPAAAPPAVAPAALSILCDDGDGDGEVATQEEERKKKAAAAEATKKSAANVVPSHTPSEQSSRRQASEGGSSSRHRPTSHRHLSQAHEQQKTKEEKKNNGAAEPPAPAAVVEASRHSTRPSSTTTGRSERRAAATAKPTEVKEGDQNDAKTAGVKRSAAAAPSLASTARPAVDTKDAVASASPAADAASEPCTPASAKPASDSPVPAPRHTPSQSAVRPARAERAERVARKERKEEEEEKTATATESARRHRDRPARASSSSDVPPPLPPPPTTHKPTHDSTAAPSVPSLSSSLASRPREASISMTDIVSTRDGHRDRAAMSDTGAAVAAAGSTAPSHRSAMAAPGAAAGGGAAAASYAPSSRRSEASAARSAASSVAAASEKRREAPHADAVVPSSSSSASSSSSPLPSTTHRSSVAAGSRRDMAAGTAHSEDGQHYHPQRDSVSSRGSEASSSLPASSAAGSAARQYSAFASEHGDRNSKASTPAASSVAGRSRRESVHGGAPAATAMNGVPNQRGPSAVTESGTQTEFVFVLDPLQGRQFQQLAQEQRVLLEQQQQQQQSRPQNVLRILDTRRSSSTTFTDAASQSWQQQPQQQRSTNRSVSPSDQRAAGVSTGVSPTRARRSNNANASSNVRDLLWWK